MIKRKTAIEFEVVKRLFTEDEEPYLNEIIRDPKFQERILLNSKSLYNKLKKIIDNGKKIDKKTKKALVKYLLRMAARPQPSRLNSGITLNQADNEKKQIKKVEISLEWEQELIKKVENSILKSSSDVKLVINPRLYKKDQQYVLEKYMSNNTSYIYFEDTKFLNMLFEILRKPVSVNEILKKFGEHQDQQLILGVIQKLITADIIKTELSSPSINRDSDAFMERLKRIFSGSREFVSALEDIQHALEMYRNADIGEGIDLYKDLIHKMSSLCKSSSYLIVDLYIYDAMDEEQNVIDQVNADDSLEIMNYFDKLHTFDWDRYYNSFAGKYGSYTRVPLLQMIDEDEGIGLPQSLQRDKKSKEIEQYILNRMMQSSSADNEGVLTLTSTDYKNMRDIYGEEGERRIPISYDCKMVPYKEQFILPPNAFSHPRNSFTGRFSLPEREEKSVNQFKYAEINYVSNYFKDVGLTHKSESDIFIDCMGQTEHSMDRVPLNEIDIIAHGSRLHMIHKDEVVYPVATHLFNYRNFNEHPALIFLNEFYMYCFEYPSNFPAEKFSYLEFIPRIEYEDFILSPARINIKFPKESTEEERTHKINELIQKYKLDRYKYIYLLEGDRSLPIPTDNNTAISFLETCKRNEGQAYTLTLMEAPELENVENEVSDWIYSSGHKEFEGEKHGYNHVKKTLEVSKDFSDKLDLNVSSYLLYYRNGKREKVEKAILNVSRDLSLEDMFLVNFIDERNKEHIRLRYRKDSKKDLELEEKLSSMLVSGDLYDFKKTLFYPEINRYGGKEIYKTVYKLFAAETNSMETFKELYADYNETGRALYLSSYMLLGLLGNDLDLLYDYLEKIEKDSTYVKPFAKRRNEYRDIALQALQDYKRDSHLPLTQYNRLSNRVYHLMKNQENLSRDELFYLVRSIIHMAMNRHFPFKRELEEEVNQFMRFVFSNINYNLRRMG
ncbi:thiopeptide-type bacteriocin biosynthesis protein [Virgibacillus sp. YIM 98842]|uniref:thiopeptide-type bacteriocin biosynthesis protein n=1 Tax=Virgibacillus sp. YIM 98842 TaxID=2663533 RepID=UPI0013D9265D|nr:thiopeptide-type bacteriocin biosynthesis protein [Virgibacillus sp. YIM 98842]